MVRSALKERLLALKARLGSEARPATDPKPSKGGPAPASGPGAVVSRAAPRSGADVIPIAERIASRGKEFAESAGPAHGRRGRSPRRERRTKSRRSRSSGASSEESACHGGRRLFRGARTVSERHALRMTERPGDLMATALEEMRRYLVTGQGASSSPGELSPIVRAYLTSVFLPSVGNTISQRNSEELRTLAEASDKILQGDFAGPGTCCSSDSRPSKWPTQMATGGWRGMSCPSATRVPQPRRGRCGLPRRKTRLARPG